MKDKILGFVKKEIVLIIAFFLSIASAFIVKPSKDYIGYIDFRVLGILLSLMVVMAGFQSNGLFSKIALGLLRKIKTTRGLVVMLALLCFFTSMLITNDVALITFVPFSIMIMKKIKYESCLLPLVVLETIASNLGSMLTPIGNPQNLYLYNIGGYLLGDFVLLVLPVTSCALVLVIITALLISKDNKKIVLNEDESTRLNSGSRVRNVIYLILFVLCLLVVIKLIPYYYVLAVTVVMTLIMERKVLLKVDYSLLFTFVFFFIFTGNLGNISYINDFLEKMIAGNEILMSILVSQAISNMPCALLLSKFTSNYSDLVIGVNLGGLGTLIASMASLISYKIFANEYNNKKGKYILSFSLISVTYLVILVGAFMLMRTIG